MKLMKLLGQARSMTKSTWRWTSVVWNNVRRRCASRLRSAEPVASFSVDLCEMNTVDGKNPIPNHLLDVWMIPCKKLGCQTTNLPGELSWSRISGCHQTVVSENGRDIRLKLSLFWGTEKIYRFRSFEQQSLPSSSNLPIWSLETNPWLSAMGHETRKTFPTKNKSLCFLNVETGGVWGS